MLLKALVLWDGLVFLLWAGVFVWFLAVPPSESVYSIYRNQHTALLVHIGTTWQLLWLCDNMRRGRVEWRSGVRTFIFCFTLILDTFMLVRTIRFVTCEMYLAWTFRWSISAMFMASDLLSLVFVGFAHWK